MTGYVHVHAPAQTAKRIDCGACPDCKKRTRFLAFFTPWYGWDSTCIRCGREWQDGYWCSLPFARGARQRNIELAKRVWRAMPPVSENHWGIDA